MCQKIDVLIIHKNFTKNLLTNGRKFGIIYESQETSEYDPLAQPAEHMTFNHGVRSSILRWVTRKQIPSGVCFFYWSELRTPLTKGLRLPHKRRASRSFFADASQGDASGVRFSDGSPESRYLRVSAFFIGANSGHR